MKKVLLTLIVLLPLFLFGQQTGETRIPVEQLEDLGDNNIIIGSPTLNNIIAFIASNMAVTPGGGLVATNVQDALDELQAEIIGGGDGWGSDVVVSDASLSGDGTVGTPLSVVQGQINTSAINNDAGFLTTDVDGRRTVPVVDHSLMRLMTPTPALRTKRRRSAQLVRLLRLRKYLVPEAEASTSRKM